ncbi:MAG: MFS transporter, partial [Coriobacteriaceae bacterium]|nr:MFS transporter [Coriobacteriaceae bacterium]
MAVAISEQMSPRKRTMIFLDIMIAIIGITFLVTAMNIALPTMKEVLGVNDSTGQWLISGYSLAMGMAMPLTAFLIHRIKTKRLYIVGIVIYLIGLVITMLGGTFVVVLFGRIFQGVGAAILMSMAQVIILTIYPPNERGKAMGNYGLAMGVAPIVASLICGMMVQYINWQSIFILAAILMAISLIMAFVVFDNVLDTIPQKFDILSFIITLLTFGGITLGIGNLFSYGIKSISTWPVLAVGIVAAIILVIRQFRMETPFLDLKTFKSTQFAIGVIGVCMLYLISLGKGVIIQQYYQSVLGWAPMVASMLVIPGSILNAVFSPIGGRMYDKHGIRTIFIVSSLILFVGCMGMVFAGSNGMVSTVVATIFYSSQSIGLGLLLMPLQTWGTAGAGEGKVVDATAVLASMRTLANSNGVVIATGVMTVFAGRMAAKGG